MLSFVWDVMQKLFPHFVGMQLRVQMVYFLCVCVHTGLMISVERFHREICDCVVLWHYPLLGTLLEWGYS